MASNLLIVESPSKASTLKKYLGPDFQILASYGHVRDLEAKEGAVDPSDSFHMRYALVERNKKHVDEIAKAVAAANTIYLATDPDREGEAIAWHLAELLKDKKLLKNKKIKRVVFYEITESAVKDAVNNPRDISMELVNAQQTRRALDHLVGFNLSPLLWKKIGPSLSAGRVQSPALRLLVEREHEIENFKSREYWTIHLDSKKDKQEFSARLTQFRGEKVEQFTFTSEAQQALAVSEVTKTAKGFGAIVKVEKKPKQRQPAAPFTTSTLQQEAVRKLGLTTDRAMRTAQQLYEGADIGGTTVGLITYMRTDSLVLSQDALKDIRSFIGKQYSPDYLPKTPVLFRNKSKNAQEAHEAIRPTSIERTPESVRKFLNEDQARLYEMIWKRTVACQMTAARFDTVSVDIGVGPDGSIFRANGQTLMFQGFMAVYAEGQDDSLEEQDAKLPALAVGDKVPLIRVFGDQHFTLPPPRYTEASLVKTLEEFGIGRPSTYANIISTLQDRGYAMLDKKRFIPTDIGRLVTGFLVTHFDHYIDYGFTASMEDSLDSISNGERDWVKVLKEFWGGFSKQLKSKQDVARGIPLNEECPKSKHPLFLQNSRRGLFVGCSGYPECDYTRPWGNVFEGPRILGKDLKSTLDVLLMKGPYGFYVQLGPTIEGAEKKPRRMAWPKNLPVESADLETALQLLSLPRVVGTHPETGKTIEANIGRFGPYLRHDDVFKSIPKAENVHTIALLRAIELLAQKKSAAGALKDLGAHPVDGKPVRVYSGRYGPYAKHGKINATILPPIEPEEITLDQAVALLDAKSAKGPGKKKSGAKPRVSARRAA